MTLLMKSNPFQKKAASPANTLEAKRHLKRFQPLPTLDFPPATDANKTPARAMGVLASQKADLQTLDSNLSPNT